MDKIAKILISEMQQDEHGYFWYTKKIGFDDTFIDSSIDLERGNPGIIIFFLELYKKSNNTDYLTIAENALNWCFNYCITKKTYNYSFYSGYLGVCYVSLLHSNITGKDLHEHSLRVAHDSIEFIESPMIDDGLAYGRSGALLVLMLLYRKTADETIKKYLERGLLILLNNAIVEKTGISWRRHSKNIQSLCGLSCGNAGIFFVLLQLGSVFDNLALEYAANQALLYENKNWSKEKKSWPDFRMEPLSVDELFSLKKSFISGDKNHFRKPNYELSFLNGALGHSIIRIAAYSIRNELSFLRNVYESLVAERETLQALNTISECLCLVSMRPDLLSPKLGRAIKAIQSTKFSENEADDLKASGNLGLLYGIAGVGLIHLRSHENLWHPLLPMIAKSSLATGSQKLPFSLKTIRSSLINSRLSRTSQIIQIINPTELEEFYDKEVNFNENLIKEFIKFCKALIVKVDTCYRRILLEIFSYEVLLLKLTTRLPSGSEIYIGEIVSFERSQPSLNLNDSDFEKITLKLSELAILKKTKWNWQLPNDSVGSNLYSKPSKFYVLLTYNSMRHRLKESILTELSYLILTKFLYPCSVRDCFKVISAHVDIPTNETDSFKNIVIEQIRNFLHLGILTQEL